MQREEEVVYNNRVKIGFYDPYLDTMGGGEKYFLDAASYLHKKSHHVYFFWQPNKKKAISEQAKERFNIDITALTFLPDVFSSKQSFLKKYIATHSLDVLFYLSDGSFPFLFSKNNILMFQHPVDWVQPSLLNTLKLRNVRTIICNSQFVEDHINKTLSSQKTTVVYPPVMSVRQKIVKKEKIVLSVGRFSTGMNAKKHDELIKAFKKLYETVKDWRLVLIGGMRDEDVEFVESLKRNAKELPVTILTNANYVTLIDYYNRSGIYWHATGYEVDVVKYPERTEHFGISVVEAMSAGCVPIVFNAGGPAEVVHEGINGFLWNTIGELVEKTKQVAVNEKLKDLQKNAERRAGDFSEKVFYEKIEELLQL